MSITREAFGYLPDGRTVWRYTLRNRNGVTCSVLNFGGILQSLKLPDRHGDLADVVWGYDTFSGYLQDTGHKGALIGRVANRIRDARFTLLGQEYALSRNAGKHHLHGGTNGFDRKLWQVSVRDASEPALELQYTSPDGEEGYPAILKVSVTYTLEEGNVLSVRYSATADAPTVVNLTTHSYFNLRGCTASSVLEHTLWLDADRYLETDGELIPTGSFKTVEGTPFDFRASKPLGRDILAKDRDLAFGNGYDHCFVFGKAKMGVCHRATLYEPVSGRGVHLFTDQPAVQLYTANALKESETPMKGGVLPRARCAVCLEPQKMTDAPHHEAFSNITLLPSQIYTHVTKYHFFTL